MKKIPFFCVLVGLFYLCSCESETPLTQVKAARPTVLVVLGNEPLDAKTPTIDMVKRVESAASFYKKNPDSVLIFTGGETTGKISEAGMMSRLARQQGVPSHAIVLEERARTTQDNARLTAKLIPEINPGRILIVTKKDHLEWAMPIFWQMEVFAEAEPWPVEVKRSDSIAQMREYLQKHSDHQRVRQRLDMLLNHVQGVD